jgi:hypothetical protein
VDVREADQALADEERLERCATSDPAGQRAVRKRVLSIFKIEIAGVAPLTFGISPNRWPAPGSDGLHATPSSSDPE